MNRIIFVGRGGQGVVKASRLLAATSLAAGLHASALPSFNFVRRGGPVEAYVRLAETPIRRKSTVQAFDYVVGFDDGMPEFDEALDRVADGATVLLNSTADPDDLDLPATIGRIGCIDATSIANDLLGRNPIPVVNTTMLGGLARALPSLSWDPLVAVFRDQFGDDAEANVEAASIAYDELRLQELMLP